jgi:hypothetical protein
MTRLYVDTSALVKWYVAEAYSDAFEAFVAGHPGALISRLTMLELRCTLARRKRNREIDEAAEREVCRTFESDILLGHLQVEPLRDEHLAMGQHFMEQLGEVPLRTLDAIHLAIAVDSKADLIATADRIMAQAAQQLGLQVEQFFA